MKKKLKENTKNILNIKIKILKIKRKKLLYKKNFFKSLIKKYYFLIKNKNFSLRLNKKKLDYKNIHNLIKYIDIYYKISSSKLNNLSFTNQRLIKLNIKYSRYLSFLPYLFIHKI